MSQPKCKKCLFFLPICNFSSLRCFPILELLKHSKCIWFAIIFSPLATALRAPIRRWEEIYGPGGTAARAVTAGDTVFAPHQTSLMSATHQTWLTDKIAKLCKVLCSQIRGLQPAARLRELSVSACRCLGCPYGKGSPLPPHHPLCYGPKKLCVSW